jgi:hypothetical protein
MGRHSNDFEYFEATCSTCWTPFTSTVSQADADRKRREHSCPGSPWKPEDDQ